MADGEASLRRHVNERHQYRRKRLMAANGGDNIGASMVAKIFNVAQYSGNIKLNEETLVKASYTMLTAACGLPANQCPQAYSAGATKSTARQCDVFHCLFDTTTRRRGGVLKASIPFGVVSLTAMRQLMRETLTYRNLWRNIMKEESQPAKPQRNIWRNQPNRISVIMLIMQ